MKRRTRRTQPLVALLAASLAACGGDGLGEANRNPGDFQSEGQPLCASGSTVPGVDVASFQGNINWGVAASSGGIKWGYAKATEGTGYQDPTFPGNWSGMRANGVVRGAYHFFHPSLNGTAQADYFLSYVGALGAGDLPPMLDWEVSDGVGSGTASQSAQAFIAEIKAKTGMATVIYTTPGIWSGFGNPGGFGGDPLWVANWTYSTSQCPGLPAGWSNWLFWQWTDGKYGTGSVPGIPATVDRDLFNGSLAQLQKLANAPPANLVSQVTGNDALTGVNWPDQHMELFAKSPSGTEYHLWTNGAGDGWNGQAALDTGAECGSAAAFWGDPWLYPELFSPLNNQQTGHLWWAKGAWNRYQAFGGSSLSHLSTLVWQDGRTEVFALGAAGAIWHDFWDTTTSSWSGWASLGGSLATGVGAIVWSNGTGELFATDSGGGVWHRWSGSGASYPGGWYPWTKMGSGMASRPIPVRWADGHVEVFVRGADGQLYHSDFSTQSGWPPFTVLSPGSPIIGEPAAIMNGSGNGASPGPEVFARDPQGQVRHLWWNGGGGYTSFTPLYSQTAASDPFAWIRADGAAEVFAVDPSGDLVRSYRGGSAPWTAWASIGTGLDGCAPPLPAADAGVPFVDAGSPAVDAGSSFIDAGSPAVDAGSPFVDAGSPFEDAGSPANDAGLLEDGGGRARSDAGETGGGLPLGPGAEDGGPSAHAVSIKGGCGCGPGGLSADAPLWLGALLAAGGLRRRRRPVSRAARRD